jgi:hypothetical protein
MHTQSETESAMRVVLHALVGLAFLGMAVIQLNDPDPAYWVVVYVLVAAIPLARIFGHRLPTVLILASGMVLSGMLIAGPGTLDYLASGDYSSMLDEKPYVESAREFVGLLTAAICLMAYAGRGRR